MIESASATGRRNESPWPGRGGVSARARSILVAIHFAAIAASGCAGPGSSAPAAHRAVSVGSGVAARPIAVDTATEDRILALAPERISEREVADLLARVPAPRIICLDGSVPIVTMRRFAEFLVAMGFPEASIRNPKNGTYSESSWGESRRLAGMLAWYYEREGMMPILIGHSQGGMLAIKVLYDLAGASGDRIAVWNPLTDRPEQRFTIVDPLTGVERPVVGLRVGYAAAIATGNTPRMLLGEWDILPKLRKIPDTVEEFAGFFVEWDLIAGTFPGTDPFRASGSATVRTVVLPADYGHITLPLTAHLAANPATRAWISEYAPAQALPPLPAGPDVDATNIVHAAEIWYSIKRHWCLEEQRLIRAKRAALRGGTIRTTGPTQGREDARAVEQ